MRFLLAAAVVTLLASSTGCAAAPPSADPGNTVVASFYPLAWAAEQVGGPELQVADLIPPGVEPHDVELTPGDVRAIRDARLVVYLSGGFQPAVEEAVGNRTGPSLDVRDGSPDPHIWLDPVRFARVVENIAYALGRPAAGAETVRRLHRLDTEYRKGLRACDRRVLVTTHEAFGALARRYGLTQLSLAGRSPESEPGPRGLERLIDEVRASHTTTVFAEPLLSQRVIRTVAREAHVRVATLDPIEGLSRARLDSGESYLTAMRGNLVVLRKALGCR